MAKKVRHEEHVDETWLIPYADMLTLLLALFIVMFATASVDQSKFQRMKEEFSAIFSEGSGVLDQTSIDPSIFESPGMREAIKMEEIVDNLNEQIQNSEFKDQIKAEITDDGIQISIQDQVLFASGEANIFDNVSPILSSIAKSLSGIGNNIRVEGHTDNVPIYNAKFRSNWELSAMRSINVMDYLIKEGQLSQKRFVIQGRGEFNPRYENTTEEGRAKNRRVELVVLRKYTLTKEEKDALEQKVTSDTYFYKSSEPDINAQFTN